MRSAVTSYHGGIDDDLIHDLRHGGRITQLQHIREILIEPHREVQGDLWCGQNVQLIVPVVVLVGNTLILCITQVQRKPPLDEALFSLRLHLSAVWVTDTEHTLDRVDIVRQPQARSDNRLTARSSICSASSLPGVRKRPRHIAVAQVDVLEALRLLIGVKASCEESTVVIRKCKLTR